MSHTTVRQWLTILESSYIIFQLSPYHANIRKRLVKSPKLYFYDVGLASFLIGIEHAGQLSTHPLRGALFENTVVSEILKHRLNRGSRPDLSFYRDVRGLECDVLHRVGEGVCAIEVKAGATVTSGFFDALNQVADLVPDVTGKAVVYGGVDRQSRTQGEVVPLIQLGNALEEFEGERRQG